MGEKNVSDYFRKILERKVILAETCDEFLQRQIYIEEYLRIRDSLYEFGCDLSSIKSLEARIKRIRR